MKPIKITPSRKVASPVLAYLVAFFYIGIPASVLYAMLVVRYWVLIPAALGVVILYVLSRRFAWYKEAIIYEFGDYVVYEVTNIVGVLGRNKSKFDIKRVDKMVTGKGTVTVYGDIIDHEPVQKAQSVRKLKIQDACDGVIDILKKVSE